MATEPLVPELRFPEFDQAWQFEPIGPHLEDCSSRVPANTELPVFSSSRSGLKKQEEYYAGREVINEGEYGVCPPGAIVYRHMSDDGQFAFNLNDTGTAIAVSKEYPVFRTKGLDSRFLLAKLNNSPDFKAFALAQKAGGTRTRLYLSKLRTWRTSLPTLLEQQKIAECLTSLEELIAAEGRKLEALRAYKRCLMHSLLPGQGETTPRLRFPEFRTAGAWQESSLGSISDLKNGYAFRSSEYVDSPQYHIVTIANVQAGQLELFGMKGIGILPRDIQGHHLLKAGDILISMTGNVGRVCRVCTDKLLLNQRVGKLVPHSVHPDFFYHLLQREDFRSEMQSRAAGGAQGNLSSGTITGFQTCIPKQEEEQSRIASCLGSLETLLRAQAERLKALRSHKQALMQSLFPAILEAA